MSAPEIKRAIEQAYRRGYQQGAYTAVISLEEGHTFGRVRLWLQTLHAWRGNLHGERTPQHENQWIVPPELPVKKAGTA